MNRLRQSGHNQLILMLRVIEKYFKLSLLGNENHFHSQTSFIFPMKYTIKFY